MIEKNLKQVARLEDAHPERNTLCLKCHVHPNIENSSQLAKLELADGVSCEVCHGPAEGWLAQHYLPSWRLLSDDAKQARGMTPTRDLLTRARLCVGCHVGSGDAEVNHDLIAAGHPRLNFEYANYLATYPRHWSLLAERRRNPDHEIRAWAVGQVVSAQQSLKLLAARAAAAEAGRGSPWPELAEYDCQSCHHSLTEATQLSGRQTGLNRPGYPEFGTWYHALLTPYVIEGGGLAPAGSLRSLERVRKLMSQVGANDPRDIVEAARDAENDLDAVVGAIASTRYSPARLHHLGLALTLDWEAPQSRSWDARTQHYLALAAIGAAWRDQSADRLDHRMVPPLRALHNLVRLPAGQTTPSKPLDRKAFDNHLLQIRSILER